MERESLITLACKKWREVLPVHPAAEIIPPYESSKLIALGRNIKTAGGMTMPITVLVEADGRQALLDGRSRLDALCAVGIKFEIKIVGGHVVIDAPEYIILAPTEIPASADFNPFAFVLSANLHRGHLEAAAKRAIVKKAITAQPNLSDRAIAAMTGVSKDMVGGLRAQLSNGESAISGERLEATGRKARGRKPKIHPAPVAKPIDVIPTPPAVADKPPAPPVAPVVAAVPIAATSVKPKPAAAPNGFDAGAALAQAQKLLAMFNRKVSAPNWDAARREAFHLIDLLLRHKTLRTAA
jgi:hypothetical protein